MDKVSILIPCRDTEEHINKTVENIYQNATGDFEVIVGYDGTQLFHSLYNYPNLHFLSAQGDVGLKIKINALAAMATGKYIFKVDSHCAFGKGFDEILQADMEDDWIVTPRFKIIKDDWSIQMRDGQEEFYDYFYLCCPFTDPKGLRFKAGGHWGERTKERLPMPIGEQNIAYEIDETPQIHGSAWFMTRDRYFHLGGFPNIDPHGHAQEPIWLALNNWVNGGKVMVNKKTWYAHLHQNSKNRVYPEDRAHTEETYNLTAEYWLKHPKFEWFVEKFMPMPTWPDNWRELLKDWRLKNG